MIFSVTSTCVIDDASEMASRESLQSTFTCIYTYIIIYTHEWRTKLLCVPNALKVLWVGPYQFPVLWNAGNALLSIKRGYWYRAGPYRLCKGVINSEVLKGGS